MTLSQILNPVLYVLEIRGKTRKVNSERALIPRFTETTESFRWNAKKKSGSSQALEALVVARRVSGSSLTDQGQGIPDMEILVTLCFASELEAEAVGCSGADQ